MTSPTDTAPRALTRAEIEAKIIKRCWEDEAFSAEFRADPAAAFLKYTGVSGDKLPRLVIHDEKPGEWHIVIPAKPAQTGELSDDELEKVAGGTDVFATISLTVVVTTAVTGGVVSAAETNDWW
ncbi:MAG: NHLP leader peptide family RiPP precursor [Alphaproteobacteria bacterium]|nr:NHLP leader peptide family RiPP precursor [Alphaproteobacteria bacterium]